MQRCPRRLCVCGGGGSGGGSVGVGGVGGVQLFSSSASASLTESEAEYVVSVVKHSFPAHTVLQFTIKNTMEEEQLENVSSSPPSPRRRPPCARACVCARVRACTLQDGPALGACGKGLSEAASCRVSVDSRVDTAQTPRVG